MCTGHQFPEQRYQTYLERCYLHHFFSVASNLKALIWTGCTNSDTSICSVNFWTAILCRRVHREIQQRSRDPEESDSLSGAWSGGLCKVTLDEECFFIIRLSLLKIMLNELDGAILCFRLLHSLRRYFAVKLQKYFVDCKTSTWLEGKYVTTEFSFLGELNL